MPPLRLRSPILGIRSSLLPSLAFVASMACAPDEPTQSAGQKDAGLVDPSDAGSAAPSADAGTAGSPADTGSMADAGGEGPVDAEVADAGVTLDAGGTPDGGRQGLPDGGVGQDAGPSTGEVAGDGGVPADGGPSNDNPAAAGSFAYGDPVPATLTVSDGSGRIVELTQYIPDGAGPFAPVLIVHGFMLAPRYYRSYAAHLASHGYLALLVDLNASLPPRPTHAAMATYLGDVLDWLTEMNATGGTLEGKVDLDRIGLAGHSMGGKLSLLLASDDARPKAVFAIDPVDAIPPDQPMVSDDFPSVTPERMGDISVPTVFVGETTNGSANLGQPCAPAAENFQQYYTHATGPALEIDVKGANHMSFIEPDLLCTACLACSAGTDTPEVTRALTRRWMTAFFDLVLRGDEAARTWLVGDGMAADEAAQLVAFQHKNGF